LFVDYSSVNMVERRWGRGEKHQVKPK
jgi:hypothetical protein